MFNIAVCDDDRSHIKTVVKMIENWSEQSKKPVKIFTYCNGDELLADSAEHKDIIFLDIFMPLLNGMEAAKELRSGDTASRIIFLTSSPEFAYESYSVKAHGYLLKPVVYQQIKVFLDEYVEDTETEQNNIVVKTNFGYQKLVWHDIEYIEAQNKKIIVHLCSGQELLVKETFHSFEERLVGKIEFFKCHRSYIVYLYNIDHFNSADIITTSGKRIPIARGCAKPLKEAYFSLMFQK